MNDSGLTVINTQSLWQQTMCLSFTQCHFEKLINIYLIYSLYKLETIATPEVCLSCNISTLTADSALPLDLACLGDHVTCSNSHSLKTL